MQWRLKIVVSAIARQVEGNAQGILDCDEGEDGFSQAWCSGEVGKHGFVGLAQLQYSGVGAGR